MSLGVRPLTFASKMGVNMIPVPPRNEAEEEQRRLQAEQRRLQAEQRRLQAEQRRLQAEEELDWVTVASFPSEPEANAVADQLKAGSINARCPDTETIGGALLAGIRALFHVQVKAQDVDSCPFNPNRGRQAGSGAPAGPPALLGFRCGCAVPTATRTSLPRSRNRSGCLGRRDQSGDRGNRPGSGSTGRICVGWRAARKAAQAKAV